LNTATGIANNGAPNSANGYLTPYADSSYTSSQNPAFQQVLTQIEQAIRPQVDGSFGAAGRYGSGANANAFASALTNTAGDLAYQNYNDASNRQLTADQQLSANDTASTNARLAALGLIPGLGATATGAGGAAINAGQSPINNFAQVLAQLGGGGGTTTNTGATTGVSTGTTINNILDSIFGTTSGQSASASSGVSNDQSATTSKGVTNGVLNGTATGSSSGSSSGFDIGSIISSALSLWHAL